MKVHLIPAPWEPTINSVKDLMEALKSGREFKVADALSKWGGATTTNKEMQERDVTHAQIRYGKNLEKVWYGELPKISGTN